MSDGNPDDGSPSDHREREPGPNTGEPGEVVEWEDVDSELELGDPALRVSLRALLAPPDDIEDRVADTVSQQLRGRSALGTALDLLGLGARTFGVILTDGPVGADRYKDQLPAERRPTT